MKYYEKIENILERHDATSTKGAYVPGSKIAKERGIKFGHMTPILEKTNEKGKIIDVTTNLSNLETYWTLNDKNLREIDSVEPFFQTKLPAGYSTEDKEALSPRRSFQALKDTLNGSMYLKVRDMKREMKHMPNKEHYNYIHGDYSYDNRNKEAKDEAEKVYRSLISKLEMLMVFSRNISPTSKAVIADMNSGGIPDRWLEAK